MSTCTTCTRCQLGQGRQCPCRDSRPDSMACITPSQGLLLVMAACLAFWVVIAWAALA